MIMITTLQQIDKTYLVNAIQSLVSQKVYYNEIQFENSFAYYISFFKNEHNYRVSFESSEPINVKKALQHIF